MWESKNHVERPCGQELGLLFFEPLGFSEGLALGTEARAAGVIGGVLIAAGITLVHVTAELGRATAFDGPHDLVMR